MSFLAFYRMIKKLSDEEIPEHILKVQLANKKSRGYKRRK